MIGNPLRSPEDYELFLYTLSDRYPSILRSTLTFVRRGISLARVSGELIFAHGLRLVVLERLTFDRLPAVIDGYGDKHHRIPAPGMSFTEPNLPSLIREIEGLVTEAR